MNTKTILDAIDTAVAERTANTIQVAAPAPEPNTAPIPPPRAPRRPGRPPKAKPHTESVLGLAEAPIIEGDVVELVHCRPEVFKKLLTLYKGYSVSEVEFLFDIDTIKLRAYDHVGRTVIYTTMVGRHMNFYYCRKPTLIKVKRDYLENILGAPEKDKQKITIILRNNTRSSFFIVVRDLDYEKDKSYEVEVIHQSDDPENIDAADDSAYPLRFVLDSKHFKNEVTQIQKISKSLIISKTATSALKFQGDGTVKPIYIGSYNNAEKIQLQSTLATDDIIHVSIPLENVKPFASCCAGDKVVIAVDNSRHVSFTTHIDRRISGEYATTIKVMAGINGGVHDPRL